MEPVNTTALQQAPSRDRSSRAESEFSIPEYRISYGQEHILQWEPPVGSKELAVALSYHFPLQVDLASKMQAATRRFLRQERDGKKSKSREQAVSREPSAGVGVEEGKDGKDDKGGTSTPALQILTWDSGMKSYGHKTKRRRYDKGERVKVAANRGFACDVHRRQKMKCDPERCSRNKQHFNSLEAIPQAHTDTSTKLEDKPMDGRDPSIHSQDLSFLSDHTDSIPQNSDGLSLYSMTTSDTSPRWSISSVMNSTNMSFSDTSNSLRPKHDSIESVLSSYDLEFLANLPSYDVSYTTDPNHDDANTMWWTPELSSAHDRNSGLIQDGYLPKTHPTTHHIPPTLVTPQSSTKT
ncbi:hypothetical protein HYFRA_00010824 [Hymenoscyphus fraxineus]|uniref:Uncharacterized protein n=1 Tax=Hymenoscyphus fraxineus TaxID=746836 RepID=A0A9N9PW49_9HELO|nr:hypothetical protein HYFRA_00010824 [Hymenoscyphus fraxineus]